MIRITFSRLIRILNWLLNHWAAMAERKQVRGRSPKGLRELRESFPLYPNIRERAGNPIKMWYFLLNTLP